MALQRGEGPPWRVLYAPSDAQHGLAEALSALMPPGRGRAFAPMMEWYRRDRKETEEKPLFPGYVFLQTDLGFREIHGLVAEARERVRRAAVRELGRLKWQDGAAFHEGDGAEEADLSEDEAAFLEGMLGGGTVVRMSEGYKEGGRVRVVSGPLARFEDQIRRVDRHNRRATMESRLMGRDVEVGLWVRPKAAFGGAGGVGELSDGSEVDLKELEKRMMRGATGLPSPGR